MYSSIQVGLVPNHHTNHIQGLRPRAISLFSRPYVWGMMALPMDHTRETAGQDVDDPDSERTSNVHDYKRVCIDFIRDISGDYKAWVDYYKLPAAEDARRRRGIDTAMEKSCQWLAKVPQSIQAVDVVMNDGIQKMAEATAGRPFQIGVFVNERAGYVSVKSADSIPFHIRAAGRNGRKTRLGCHYKERFRIDSTCNATIHGAISDTEYNDMDLWLELRLLEAKPGDIVSFTVIVAEIQDGNEVERRGQTTIIHLV